MRSRLRVSPATDVGRVRKDNEDAFLVDEELKLFVVADGMGGHAAGEVASRMAVDTVRRVLREGRQTLVDFETGTEGVTRTDVIRMLETSVQEACAAVHQEGVRDESKRGMGTTLDALLMVGTRGFIAHVGDSRAYLYRQGSVHQLTEDHSLINELLRRGRLTREQVERVQYKNAVTRAVGIYESVEVDVIDFDVLAGDRFLLCSDGLHGYLEDNEIPGIFENTPPDSLAQTLIALANDRGGKDNITAVVVHIPDSETGVDRLASEVNLKLEVLHRMALFRHLTYKELVRLLNYTEMRQCERGELICEEGADGDDLYVVLKGNVTVHTGTTVLAELSAGEYFGELALVDRSARSASVTAGASCQLLSIKRKHFFEIMRRDHDVAIKLLWSFLNVTTGRMRGLSRELGQVRERTFMDDETTRFRIDPPGAR